MRNLILCLIVLMSTSAFSGSLTHKITVSATMPTKCDVGTATIVRDKIELDMDCGELPGSSAIVVEVKKVEGVIEVKY